MTSKSTSKTLPLLPLRDIVVFPHMMVPLYVGRPSSIAAVEEAVNGDGDLVLAAQKEARTNSPKADDIFTTGTVGKVMQHIKRPDGTVKILVEGRVRAKLNSIDDSAGHFKAEIETFESSVAKPEDTEGLVKSIVEAFDNYVKLSKRLQPDVISSIENIRPARLSDTIAAHLPIKHQDKQDVLQTPDANERLARLLELIQSEVEILQVEQKIRSRVKKQMERSEKEYYLNEQMRAIQKELGDRDEFKNELGELEDKVNQKNMPAEAKERVLKELKKLKLMAPMSAEATVIRNYIDWCLQLPWNDITDDVLDIVNAESILNEDHFGLEKPKERILEFLAVHQLVEELKGPILCLVGPPGVGKTSLAKSIARAMGREFVRMSLGGVRDEAEIRGHRRTYIGAMPGKIIQSLKKAGSSNPVFLLDEIDKMSTDFRGDPASALLEVLDPQQNGTFNDHYLDLDYDLSKVLFVCTANNMQGIPLPLQDRMEVIRIAGYTEDEKMAIADKYLIPRQRKENGITEISVNWVEEATRTIIQNYTREAGVRTLEREISAVCRKIAREVLEKGKEIEVDVSTDKVKEFLGIEKFRLHAKEEESEVGVSTGLAWTQVGGDILQIEAGIMPGKGRLTITGKLGDVMQESAQAAMSYVRSRSSAWGLRPDFYQHVDIHIHVPEGAMPKDGPSAGITMCTALVSALTQIPVRNEVAMTGEITLRGNVLPIGGLKEKALAAHRAGIYNVVVPAENEKDLADVPETIANHMNFIVVKHVDDVLQHALELENPEEFTRQARQSSRFEVSALEHVKLESPEHEDDTPTVQ